jgi:hypothetical protein
MSMSTVQFDTLSPTDRLARSRSLACQVLSQTTDKRFYDLRMVRRAPGTPSFE